MRHPLLPVLLLTTACSADALWPTFELRPADAPYTLLVEPGYTAGRVLSAGDLDADGQAEVMVELLGEGGVHAGWDVHRLDGAGLSDERDALVRLRGWFPRVGLPEDLDGDGTDDLVLSGDTRASLFLGSRLAAGGLLDASDADGTLVPDQERLFRGVTASGVSDELLVLLWYSPTSHTSCGWLGCTTTVDPGGVTLHQRHADEVLEKAAKGKKLKVGSASLVAQVQQDNDNEAGFSFELRDPELPHTLLVHDDHGTIRFTEDSSGWWDGAPERWFFSAKPVPLADSDGDDLLDWAGPHAVRGTKARFEPELIDGLRNKGESAWVVARQSDDTLAVYPDSVLYRSTWKGGNREHQLTGFTASAMPHGMHDIDRDGLDELAVRNAPDEVLIFPTRTRGAR